MSANALLKMVCRFSVLRSCSLYLMFRIFNLLNRQDKYLSARPTSTSTDAAPALQYQQNWTGVSSTNWPSRQVQLGARLSF